MERGKKQLSLIIATATAIFVIASIFRLMFVYGYKYKSLSDNNRVRKKVVVAKRGAILDRLGEVLVRDAKNGEEYARVYGVGEGFGHILGYIGHTETQNNGKCQENRTLLDQDDAGLAKKSGIGGIESAAECVLRGVPGIYYTEVNSHEESGKKIESIPPKEGDDIKLTIDSRLQKKSYESFEGIPGAAIVLDAKSSEILALVSAPSFDPSKMGTDSSVTADYLSDPDQPLFNRATLGIYPPGSVFKMVVAAAALDEGKVSPLETIKDTGYRMVGGRKYTNWLYTEYGGQTDGEVDMLKSLKRSNDIYFYEIGSRLGVDLLAKYSHTFGYGAKSGIELADVEGTVPSSFWKAEKVGDKWFLGDTYNFSIGQGYLLVTPLQVAVMTQIFANDGNYCSPTILIDHLKNSVIKTSRTCKKIPVKKETLELIKKGMVEACAVKGTAWPFFDINSPQEATTPAKFTHYKSPKKIACKTGTAEHYVKGNEEPHGWLTLFAPADDPKIVITVLAEKGGQGSDSAGPIARKILDEAKALGLW